MIDWGVVAAFTGSLVATIAASAEWVTYLVRKRETSGRRTEAQIRTAHADFACPEPVVRFEG